MVLSATSQLLNVTIFQLLATLPEGREGTSARERIVIADVNSSPPH